MLPFYVSNFPAILNLLGSKKAKLLNEENLTPESFFLTNAYMEIWKVNAIDKKSKINEILDNHRPQTIILASKGVSFLLTHLQIFD